MKINLKLSSKMHLFIIISCVVIAIGLAVGTICNFVANGFFNYGADYESYKSVTVNYENIDFSGSGKEPLEVIEEICENSFKDAGVSNHIVTFGEINGNGRYGGEIEYRFSYGVDYDKLNEAVEVINTQIKANAVDDIRLSYASAHTEDAILGSGLTLTRAAIVISCLAVVHFIYFVIRYGLTAALGALLADVHNFALFVALAAMLRIPVGASVATYAVITVLLTVIGTCFLFDRVRKNAKSDEGKKLSAFELADTSANESFMINVIIPAVLAAVSVLLFVLFSISSLSPAAIISPVLLALISFISCAYGTSIFTPAVYSRFKLLGENLKSTSKTNKSSK